MASTNEKQEDADDKALAGQAEDAEDNDFDRDGGPEVVSGAALATTRARAWTASKGPSRGTEARESRRRRSISRRARRKLLLSLGGGSIALALIAGLLVPSLGQLTGANTPSADLGDSNGDGASTLAGNVIPIQTGAVIEVGTEHDAYSVLPPTSGPRYAEGAPWGVHEAQVDDEFVVRNLEQGGVVVSYNLSDEAATADLRTFVEAQDGYPGCFIMHPYSGITAGSVTLTSWGWIDSYAGVNRGGMQPFVDDHLNAGPEYVSATCGDTSAAESAAAADGGG